MICTCEICGAKFADADECLVHEKKCDTRKNGAAIVLYWNTAEDRWCVRATRVHIEDGHEQSFNTFFVGNERWWAVECQYSMENIHRAIASLKSLAMWWHTGRAEALASASVYIEE